MTFIPMRITSESRKHVLKHQKKMRENVRIIKRGTKEFEELEKIYTPPTYKKDDPMASYRGPGV